MTHAPQILISDAFITQHVSHFPHLNSRTFLRCKTKCTNYVRAKCAQSTARALSSRRTSPARPKYYVFMASRGDMGVCLLPGKIYCAWT